MKKNKRFYFLSFPVTLTSGILLLLLVFLTPIAQAQNSPNESGKEKGNLAYARDKKWYLIPEFSLLIGTNGAVFFDRSPLVVAPSFQVSGGYKISSWLQAGLGTGYSHFGSLKVFPIFAQLRGNSIHKKVNYYYSIKAGGSQAGLRETWQFQEVWGGFMGEAQAGFIFGSGRTNFLFGGGYHMQMIKLEGAPRGWQRFENSRTQYQTFRRFALSTSVQINF